VGVVIINSTASGGKKNVRTTASGCE